MTIQLRRSTCRNCVNTWHWYLRNRYVGFVISSLNCILIVRQTLYSGTVRFNVLLGATTPHSEVTQKEIEEACRNANILDFLQSLPEYVSDFFCILMY